MLFREYQLLAQSGAFDAEYYLGANPDIAALNIDPLLHYLEQGAKEGRGPRPDFDVGYYLEQCRLRGEEPANPLLHFVTIGAREGLKTQPNGDSARLPGVAAVTAPAVDDGLRVGIEGIAIETMSDDSRRLTLRGWAIGDEPIVGLSLSFGHTVLGNSIYGLFRPDIAAAHQQHAKADHCGYALSVETLPPELSGIVSFTLTVQFAGGKQALRSFSADTDTSKITRTLNEGERIAPAARRHWTAAPLRLQVDELEVNSQGVLEISGWAVCFLDIAAIRILVGDVFLGVAEFGTLRDDVATACPDYPRARQSGFHLRAPIGHLGAGAHVVKIQALAQSGITREVLVPVVIPDVGEARPEPEAFHFHCDEVSLTTNGRLGISGWAVSGAPMESIGVRIGAESVGLAQIGLPRPDVGNIYSHHPHARQAGFAFRQALGIGFATGEHILTLTIKDQAGVAREMPLPIQAVKPQEPERTVGADLPADEPDRAMWIDSPLIVDGAAETSITNSLSIGGWAIAKAGVKAINIAVDGSYFATAHYGMRRQDVGARYPNRASAAMSGFAALIPNWTLPKGKHTVSIAVVDNAGESTSVDFAIQVEQMPEGDGPWRIRRKIAQSEVGLQARILKGLRWRPAFRLLIKMEASAEGIDKGRLTLGSLREQAYENWDALIVVSNGKAISTSMRASLLAGFDDISSRITVLTLRRKLSLASLMAADAKATTQASFLSLLSAGDVLGCDALLELAVATALERDANFLYSDERRPSPVTKSIDAYFKPGWSPDLLFSTNYIGRIWAADAELLDLSATTVDDWLAHGDYDVVLRITENTKRIIHVAKVLCERADDHLDSARIERQAIERAMFRRSIKGKVKAGCAPGIYQVIRKRMTRGLVSIIIPTCAGAGRVRACLRSLKKLTAYRNFEIICIENIPATKARWKRWLRQNADIVIESFEPFNWSRYNNLCAERASGEFLLFLNDDVEITESGWLDTLLRQAERPEVGIAGPQLLYGDGSVQHAGLALTALGQARHVFRHARPDDPGYFGLALTERNVIGVTGACLLTRRTVFDAVGRFDEAHTIVNNDLDFCLKSWRAGYLNVYSPHAQLIHHELASRSEMGDDYDSSAFVGEWREVFVNGDPYLNVNLSREFDDLSPEREPVKTIFAGHPLLAPDAVNRILVLKLDHIGDCLMALPALRRLKEIFPKARLSVLAARSTQPIWTMEPAVDESLDFEFFHVRSGQGRKEIDEDDLLALRSRLEHQRFDLAIDLRKSTDTRGILKYTGARFLAGFDQQAVCPWLDISLELEADTRYAAKRQHVADDLLNLIEAIATSCRPERSILSTDSKLEMTLPAADQAKIFSKAVVCIHPACGNEMRQWPSEYFAELIDLLIAKHDVHVVILGGPDETIVEQKVLQHVRQRNAVFSLIGKLKLAEVPVLIKKCALFIGNNSGPHHMAAALGVPTIGVHSGVVDANEWGPLGDNAVAVQRKMSCSPCYIEKPIDCPKNMACLKGLTPASVYRAAIRMLALRSAPPAMAAKIESRAIETGKFASEIVNR